jgi:hypothetical protein
MVNNAAARPAPNAAPTASIGVPPSARRIVRHTAPSQPKSTTAASKPTNAAHRSWSFLSTTNFAIFAAESSGFGGLPGRNALISISTTKTTPASDSDRSVLRPFTRPPLVPAIFTNFALVMPLAQGPSPEVTPLGRSEPRASLAP